MMNGYIQAILNYPMESIDGEQVLDALFSLVSQYEIRGFKEGVKVGVLLASELK